MFPVTSAQESDPQPASGNFAWKLGRWFQENRAIYMGGRPAPGPMHATDLMRALNRQGEVGGNKVGQSTVSNWEHGKSKPHARFIPLIETLMGAPWAYLDDPETPWPPDLAHPVMLAVLRRFMGLPDGADMGEIIRVAEKGGSMHVSGRVAGPDEISEVALFLEEAHDYVRSASRVVLAWFKDGPRHTGEPVFLAQRPKPPRPAFSPFAEGVLHILDEVRDAMALFLHRGHLTAFGPVTPDERAERWKHQAQGWSRTMDDAIREACHAREDLGHGLADRILSGDRAPGRSR